MSKKIGLKLGSSNLPVPTSQGHLADSRGMKMTHSADDIPKQIGVGLSVAASKDHSVGFRRAISPGEIRRKSMITPARPHSQASNPIQQLGVRYITEDLIKKIAKESNFDLITSLSLTLSKEGGKKIKYIENLERLRKLQTLNLSYNIIEKMERLDKFLRLQDLNLSNNMITKIEGIENLTALQTLNLNDNQIEHIPLWFSKKLKALRKFKIARNKLNSLSEVGKLKPLPDLIELDVSHNPLTTLPHFRMYIIFHVRTVEILDNQIVMEKERRDAQERFSNDAVELLEKKLEEEGIKYRQLSDSHSKSLQEKSLQETSQHQLESKEKNLQEKLKQLEQELAAKDELLKRKTSDLNKASQKHYQLEQELAFYKIDSKFDSLKEAPNFQLESGDESSDLQESPYIGRARFKVNKYAQESNLSATAQKAQLFNINSSPETKRILSSSQKDILKENVNKELEEKQLELQQTKEKLNAIHLDLSNTEKMLLNATTELKKIATVRATPEPFQDDSKFKLRQRLTRKMQRVNELRNSASQMYSELDRMQTTITKSTSELQRLKSQLPLVDSTSPQYQLRQKEIIEKESQLKKLSDQVFKLKKEHQDNLSIVAKETNDIKKLEEQLTKGQIETSEDARHELDDIVSNLSVYLENIKDQSQTYKQEVQTLTQEKSQLEGKIKRMEADLQKLETETSNAKQMQLRLTELEDSLRRTEETKNSVQLNDSKLQELQDRLQKAEGEAKQLKQTLSENEKKIEIERKGMQKQLQSEKERVDKMTQKIQDVNRQELETKKLLSQLESAKALNAGLKDQVEEFKQKHSMDDSSFKPSELKKKLTKFTHEFKTNKSLIQPEGRNDILGMAFQEVQKHAQEQINTSIKEVEKLKKYKEQADVEIQTLKEKVKKTEQAIRLTQNQNDSKLEEENKKLEDELKKLQKALEEARNRSNEVPRPVRIVYRPDSDNGDKASSLDSDEKQLFDELQKELLDLKRFMRSHENDLSEKLLDAETEATHWKEEMNQKEKEFASEIEEYRQAAELQREKQEARIQVIAQDLDQAQFVADALQSMLEAKEKALSEEFSNAGITNQMISTQEEELVKLYDILEKQRDEIENLNQMLDHLAQQGPDGVGAGFDDELWRIRQEVNSLKETLAMQSAYVQAMPNVGHIGTQAYGGNSQTGTQAYDGNSVLDAVIASNQHRNEAYIYNPRNISEQTSGKRVTGSQAASVASTHQSSVKPLSAYSSRSGGVSKSGTVPAGRSSIASAPLPLIQGYLPDGDVHKTVKEHLGTERRESKNHPHGKSAMARQAASQPTAPKSVEWRSHPEASQKSNQQPTNRNHFVTDTSVFQPVHHLQTQSTLHPFAAGGAIVSTANGDSAANSGGHVSSPRHFTGQYQGNPASGHLQTLQLIHRPGTTTSQHGTLQYNTAFPEVVYPQSSSLYVEQPISATLPGIHTPNVVPQLAGIHPLNGAPQLAANYIDTHFQVPLQQPSSTAYNQPGYQSGQQIYIPVGPMQTPNEEFRRTYVSAGAGHRGLHPARLYYPAQQTVMLSSTGDAPNQPSGGNILTPGYGHQSFPLAPLASGTPVHNGQPPVTYYDQTSFVAPSPIRAVQMETYPKSILKQGATDQTFEDESYLFCNVPEHHDLEDYIVELQKTIEDLKSRIHAEEKVIENSKIHEDRKIVKKLLNELEDRREELEGLDLAIERQKKNLRDMKEEEKDLRRERKEAHSELNLLRKKNDRKFLIRRRRIDDITFDEEVERSRIKYLTDELKCVEKALAKRHAQLKECERNLKECNNELKSSKEQVRETMKRYDDVSSNIHQALKEQQELEKRSNDIAVDLVKATEQFNGFRADIKDLERKKNRQEKLLREINNIIAKKDGEFKEMDAKMKTASENLQRVQAELAINTEREKEMVQSLRDSEDVLAKRKADIKRLNEQVAQGKQELEKLDQEMGRKKTDFQLLQETYERKQQELTNVLQEAETDITTKHRMIKDSRADVENLTHQKADLNAHIKTKKMELQKIKEEIEQEEEVLQRLMNNVTKNKTELKHTLEMQKIEQNELENIKSQQAQKLSELERTQRALQEEKSELEQLNAETVRKSADLERLRQAVERDRLEVDQLTNDRQILDDRISVLTRDHELLNENCKKLQEKLNSMKRNHHIMEEKINSTNNRFETAESELRLKEREMETAQDESDALQKEIQSLKISIIEKKQELNLLQDNIQESEEKLKLIDKDVRNTFLHRDEAKLELEHINDQIHQSSIGLDEHIRQEKTKYKELQELLRTLADREREHQDTCLILNKLKNDVESEENHLKKLITKANSELVLVKDELTAKSEELEFIKIEYSEIQKSNDELQLNEEKCLELSKTCQSLEDDLRTKTEEKSELTRALSESYENIQLLQDKNFKIKEKLAKERLHFENTLKDLQGNLDQTKQEVKHIEKRSSNQVAKLQTFAEKHFNRANVLETELSQAKKEVFLTKQQSEKVNDNKENVSMTEVIIVPSTHQPPLITSGAENHWTKDPLRKRLTEEQDYLKFQLKQQMLRHSETIESARIKSEETIECLRKKLNTLQQVLFDTKPRSTSPGYMNDIYVRQRNLVQLDKNKRRSKSSENISFLDNDCK